MIYINDLSKNLLSSITIFFADDTSILSVFQDVDVSTKQLNDVRFLKEENFVSKGICLNMSTDRSLKIFKATVIDKIDPKIYTKQEELWIHTLKPKHQRGSM